MAWNPFRDLNRELEEMRRRIEAMAGFPQEMGRETGRGLAEPAAEFPGAGGMYVDVVDEDRQYVVTADLPGVRKEDIHVTVEENDLVIEAESRHEEEKREQGYLRRERQQRRFHRRIPLPGGVKPEDAKSTFRNGVLEVTLPKSEERKRGHEIDIE